MKLLVTFLAVIQALSGISQCILSGPALATSYVSNNGGKGGMFDITATNTVTLSCFDVNLILGSNSSYEVYYKAGSYVGSESTAANWTLIGSNPSVPCVGFDSPSPLNIPLNVVVPAGQTYGFYITCTNVSSTGGIRYTNNSGYTTIASDGNITIAGGTGKAYPFLANYNNRSFNGTVHYNLGIALPVELSAFTAKATDRNVELSWITQAEIQNDFFTIDRSLNFQDWEVLETVKGAGNSSKETYYSAVDKAPFNGSSYYRLSQTNLDGTYKVLETRAVSFQNEIYSNGKLVVSPNPASGFIIVYGVKGDQEISVTDMSGRKLYSLTDPGSSEENHLLDISGLQKGTFIIWSGNKSALFVKE